MNDNMTPEEINQYLTNQMVDALNDPPARYLNGDIRPQIEKQLRIIQDHSSTQEQVNEASNELNRINAVRAARLGFERREEFVKQKQDVMRELGMFEDERKG